MEKPVVGSWVKVTTDYSEAKKNFHWVLQKRFESIGKVIESQEWEGENTFALLTRDPKMPLKTIDMKYVSHIELIQAEENSPESTLFTSIAEQENAPIQTFEVKSSRGNKTYIVTKEKFNWSCTCEAGQRGRRCKHVTEAQLKLKSKS